jgi:hypothetical protein
MGVSVDCVSGPATDNSAGVDYITVHFNIDAANGRAEPARLAGMVEQLVFAESRVLTEVVA